MGMNWHWWFCIASGLLLCGSCHPGIAKQQLLSPTEHVNFWLVFFFFSFFKFWSKDRLTHLTKCSVNCLPYFVFEITFCCRLRANWSLSRRTLCLTRHCIFNAALAGGLIKYLYPSQSSDAALTLAEQLVGPEWPLGKHAGDIRSEGKSLMKVNNPSGPEEPGGFLTSGWTQEESEE